jgi:hypothetical protein
MAAISADIKKLLARTKLAVLPEDYYLIHLPLDTRLIAAEWFRPATTRFAVFIREPRGISLVVPRRKWLRMRNIFGEHRLRGPLRVITLEMPDSLDISGYISALINVLAQARISIVPVSSMSRDHILVNKADLPRSVRILRNFLQSCGE